MPSSFEHFQKQLDEAIELIACSDVVEHSILNLPEAAQALVDTQSLIARCEMVCQKYQPQKPVLRIIHHMACSGGTLISKCIAAMPNVYLLSEVHPYSDLARSKDKPNYAPSDIILLSKYAGIPNQTELSGKLFKKAIDVVYQHLNTQGGTLVLRDHTHVDFCTNSPIPKKSAIIELLEEDYEIKSVLTIRDPIDSYASLVKNGWVHFEPKSFDEYCRRLLLLIEQFDPQCIFKYEDFIDEPSDTMKAITEKLLIDFNNSFEDVFSLFKMTGDSGRTSGQISSRVRYASEGILSEAKNSKYYQNILDLHFLK